MTSTSTKVVATEGGPFGGSRISGAYSVSLWSDGVVIAAAYDSRTSITADFRGTIARNPWATKRHAWVLREVDGLFVDDFATRGDAITAVGRMVTLAAFRELNRIEAAR